jgi:hypothetical protein
MKFEGIEIAQFQIPSSFQISSSISITSNFISSLKASAEERATSSNYRFTQQIKNIDDSLTISGYIRSPRAIEADILVNTSIGHQSDLATFEYKKRKIKKSLYLELRAFRICIQYLENRV